jgi:broad specificity phosphatase PhoE
MSDAGHSASADHVHEIGRQLHARLCLVLGIMAIVPACRGYPLNQTLLLIRHGHVPGITPDRFRGRMELALTEEGLEQASRTADYVCRTCQPAAIFCSPMGRCVSTAQAISERCHLPVEIVQSLTDIDYGGWQWKTKEEVARDSPEQYRTWMERPALMQFPGGESFQNLLTRAADAVRAALARSTEGPLILVAHDSVNRAMLLQLLDLPMSAYWRLAQSPCAISEVQISQERIVLARLNQTTHLT